MIYNKLISHADCKQNCIKNKSLCFRKYIVITYYSLHKILIVPDISHWNVMPISMLLRDVDEYEMEIRFIFY